MKSKAEGNTIREDLDEKERSFQKAAHSADRFKSQLKASLEALLSMQKKKTGLNPKASRQTNKGSHIRMRQEQGRKRRRMCDSLRALMSMFD